jgi:hypothetical protein
MLYETGPIDPSSLTTPTLQFTHPSNQMQSAHLTPRASLRLIQSPLRALWGRHSRPKPREPPPSPALARLPAPAARPRSAPPRLPHPRRAATARRRSQPAAHTVLSALGAGRPWPSRSPQTSRAFRRRHQRGRGLAVQPSGRLFDQWPSV